MALDFDKLRTANQDRMVEWMRDSDAETLSLSFHGNELAGETGEACNIIKKMERTTLGLRGGIDFYKGTYALAEELADVVICADLIANHLGLNLGSWVREKFNRTSLKHDLKTMITED